MLCVSPDAASNPVLYWLGSYAAGRFDLASAAGPFRLDLGDVLYAPNILADGAGRHLLWGWLQVGAARGQRRQLQGCRACWPGARRAGVLQARCPITTPLTLARPALRLPRRSGAALAPSTTPAA
jgi:hypothetical protein